MFREVFRCVWRIKLYRLRSAIIQITRILIILFFVILCFCHFIFWQIWPRYVCQRAFGSTSDVSGVPNYIDSMSSDTRAVSYYLAVSWIPSEPKIVHVIFWFLMMHQNSKFSRYQSMQAKYCVGSSLDVSSVSNYIYFLQRCQMF